MFSKDKEWNPNIEKLKVDYQNGKQYAYYRRRKINMRREIIYGDFLWGCTDGIKKIPCIYWNSVLASKLKGGLGIGSLEALNLSLIQKWRWRFFNSPQALWVKVISEIHGSYGTAGSVFFHQCGGSGTWSRIVGAINDMHDKGIIPHSSIKHQVKDGSATRFWRDAWLDDIPLERKFPRRLMSSTYKSREAYATVLHSSETYVCGAIALAQSILQTNSTKDLILLADASISSKSIRGLKAAGWKIKLIERIRSPHAKKGAYNEYNYSKLRIWQLTEYDKVIFIDADLIVLKKLDKFFSYPQLSAVGNDKYLFNSGLILIEPSQCMFNGLMEKISTLGSYNGGDQGFLNEAFTWWHRFHSKLNHLKIFHNTKDNRHDIMDGLYTIHYLGLKPWLCYKDYDCNWDMLDRRRFASDSAHKKWWKVYETMNSKLRPFCGLTKQMDARIRKWRRIAKSSGFKDEHWKIKVKDRRQTLYMKL
ncbi:putative UDP-glucuronate:xylan alpha-glucuronosyltransferase 5 [Tanacetum coccineum]